MKTLVERAVVVVKPYLSISRVRSSCGLQNDRYVVRNVRTKLGSTNRHRLDNKQSTSQYTFVNQIKLKYLNSLHSGSVAAAYQHTYGR